MEISLKSVQVGKSLRNDVLVCNQDQCLEFSKHSLFVNGPTYCSSRLDLFRRTGSNLLEHLLLCFKETVNFRETFVHVQSSCASFRLPFFAVAVSLESNGLSLHLQIFDDISHGLPLRESVIHQSDLFGDSGRNDCHGEAGILGRTDCSELKSIASVGVGTGAVSVSIFLLDAVVQKGKDFLQILAGMGVLAVQEVRQCCPQEDREYSGWSLVTSKPNLVTGSGNCCKVQFVVP